MRKTIGILGISLLFLIGIAGQASARKIHCWDLNENYDCDLETEDINEDGKCNPRDCPPEPPCISCWDLNGDGECDFDEDKNGDDICDAYDCQGLHCWDSNGNWSCDLATEDKNTDGICDALDCQYAGVPQTGQQTSYEPGDDGDLQMGVVWPNPRFTDNEDGTVTDNLTGLLWTEDANIGNGRRTWSQAISDCEACMIGDNNDWRLPNVKELHSLIHFGYYNPALPDTTGTGQWTSGNSFTNVLSDYYWSSSTWPNSTETAWRVGLLSGNVDSSNKGSDSYVWCVRGGN